MIVWILLLFVGSSRSHFYGSVTTYDAKKHASLDGAYLVEVRSEMTTTNCSVGQWNCPCTTNSTVTELVDERSDGLCQTQTTTLFQVSSDAPFQINMSGGSLLWVDNDENVKAVRGLAMIDLRKRSDTGQANRSPQTAIMTPIRIPSNCARQMPLLVLDSDSDVVLCRFASTDWYECPQCTNGTLAPFLTLTPTCVLSWAPSSSPPAGVFVLDLRIEDYPWTDPTLTQSNGTQEKKSTSDPIGLVPLQFVLNLTSSIQSCAEGEFVPKFVDPTPEYGTWFNVKSGDTINIFIRAEASAAKVEELLFSGPINVTKINVGDGRFTLTWTPPADVNGRSFPLCFIARAQVDSEIRCVILSKTGASSSTFFATSLAYYTSLTSDIVMVTFRVKLHKHICFTVPETRASIEEAVLCVEGDCGNSTFVGYYAVDRENNGLQCETETVFSLKSTSISPFVANIGPRIAKVDLRIRSDTKHPNRPPLINGLLVERIPKNCEREYKLLAFDEDGDEVKICPSITDNTNCVSCSNISSYGTTFCSYPFKPGISVSGYVADFPRQNLSLMDASGSQEVKLPGDDISGYEFHILLLVDGNAPSCTEGIYIPKFTWPTPEFGEVLNATIEEELTFEVSAKTNTSKVSELLFSGPHEMKKLIIREGQFQLLWTPSEAERGQSHPVCFLVEAVIGSLRYTTETRCVLVRVASTNATAQNGSTDPPLTTLPPPVTADFPLRTSPPPVTADPPLTTSPPPDTADPAGGDYTAAVNVKLMSRSPLNSSDTEDVLTQFKNLLVGMGLPPETPMKILNVTYSGQNKP